MGAASFESVTWRLFKLPGLDDRCEDYGQIAVYAEPIPGVGASFLLDDHHLFELGRPERVCGNTAAMLTETRYSPFFSVEGDRSTHFGLFTCGETLAMSSAGTPASASPSTTACC